MQVSTGNRKQLTEKNMVKGSAVIARLSVMKIPLCFQITFTAAVGYILKSQSLDSGTIYLFLGVFLLASGAAALNNFQDRSLDASIGRTQNRPIPSGLIDPNSVLIQGAILVILGTLVLALTSDNFLSPVLGISAVVFYNLLYTPIKRYSIYAIIPGVICGMIPPYLGWIHAGGEPFSYFIILLATIVGIWQIPHYWIILMQYQQDYRKSKVIPTFLRVFDDGQIKRTLFVWIMSFACLTLLPVMVGLVKYPLVSGLLILNALVMVIGPFVVLFREKNNRSR